MSPFRRGALRAPGGARSAPLRFTIAILLLSGVVFVGESLWIYAKAQLAQVLLHRAWRLTLAGRTEVKPWPWADTFPVARLRVPRAGADTIVLAGASGRTLAFGPAHLDGTAMPGTSGNCVLSAHRDTQFASLRQLRDGDLIEIVTRDGRTHHYRVSGARVVEKHDTSVLQSGPAGRLTLITCYPFDAVVPGGPLRYIVFADLV